MIGLSGYLQGSSKNSLVGEVSIDFADYAEASKTSTVSIPFKNSKSNGVLHVSSLVSLSRFISHRYNS